MNIEDIIRKHYPTGGADGVVVEAARAHIQISRGRVYNIAAMLGIRVIEETRLRRIAVTKKRQKDMLPKTPLIAEVTPARLTPQQQADILKKFCDDRARERSGTVWVCLLCGEIMAGQTPPTRVFINGAEISFCENCADEGEKWTRQQFGI